MPGASEEVTKASEQLAASTRTAAALEAILTAATAEVLAEDKRKAGEFVAADTLLAHGQTMLERDPIMVSALDESLDTIDTAELTKRIAKLRRQIAKKVAKEKRAKARAEKDSGAESGTCTPKREQVAVEVAGELWRDPTMSDAKAGKIVRRVGKRHGMTQAEADLAYGLCNLNPRVVAAINAASK